MAGKEEEYRRLPGSRGGVFSLILPNRPSLWLGKDHLLYVMNHGYSEEYKRFYYAGIQGIVAARTPWGRIWNYVLGSLTLVLLSLIISGFIRDWPAPAVVILACAAFLFFIIFLVNLAKGPTCNCCLRTAVQTTRLESLTRWRTAMRVIATIRDLAELDQGRLPAAEPPPPPAEAPPSAPEPVGAALAPAAVSAGLVEPAAPPAVPLRHYYGRAHEVLFIVLLEDLCHSCLELLTTGKWLHYGSIIILVGVFISSISALVKQHRSDLPAAIRAMPWWSLGYMVVANIVAVIYSLVVLIRNPELAQALDEFPASPYDSPFLLGMLILSMFFSATVGFTGLRLLHKFRSAHSSPPPVPAPPPIA